MNLIPAFLQRRLWILSHIWLSELALALFLPVVFYLAVAVSLEGLVTVPLQAESFHIWVVPGIIFIVVLVWAYFPLLVDLLQDRKLHSFFESVAGSPNTPLSITGGIIVSLLPDVVIKALLASLIVQLLTGHMFAILPFIGFMVFASILGFLILNFSLTLSLVARRAFSHLLAGFVVLIFLIFSSGWIIPLDVFPKSVIPVFSVLPFALLAEGGRMLLFNREITVLTWLVPLAMGLVWTLVNAVIFARVSVK